MGHPKKTRKKYDSPGHPWQKTRIEQEKILLKEYGLKNKQEIWKTDTKLRRIKKQAKKLSSVTKEQAKKKKEQLIARLFKYNLIKKGIEIEEVLELTPKDFLERRLQTLVYKKGLARSVKQARQFITHGHIFIGNQKITVPSYFVKIDEENKITYNPSSSLAKEDHPEHPIKKELTKEEKKIIEKKEDKK